jgi:hypothetical protein
MLLILPTIISLATSIKLRDIWMSKIAADGGAARIDILSWLSKMTLDVIGLAGILFQ